MAFQITTDKRVIIGKDALEQGAPYLKAMGKKALIVTGKHITKSGMVDKLVNKLQSLDISSVIFNDVPGETDDLMVEACKEAYKKNQCDMIIGFGGGSPLDTAKATACMSKLSGTPADYAGKMIEGQFPPLVLIPTTAGTGAEATKFFCVTDTKTQAKLLLKGDDLLPTLALVDYSYTLDCPQNITAATGMDALTHAVEAYTSVKANLVTDMYALDAIKRIFKSLPICFKDGQNISAREDMSFAAYEAGFCINNSSVTLVHGMSRPIGALFHVPHGISNAMLITECLRFALPGAYDKFAKIAYEIGAASYTDDIQTASNKFIDALEKLTKELSIPSLREYGVPYEKFKAAEDKMASDALASGSPSNTVRKVTKEDEIKIYEKLWDK